VSFQGDVELEERQAGRGNVCNGGVCDDVVSLTLMIYGSV